MGGEKRVIFATGDMNEAITLADHTIVLSKGIIADEFMVPADRAIRDQTHLSRNQRDLAY